MTDMKPRADEPKEEGAGSMDRRVAGRRRFLTTGAVAAPMIMTLASRPALAKKKMCSVSIMASGNTSKNLPASCGVSPGCWKNHAANDWPPPYRPTDLVGATPALNPIYTDQWRVHGSGKGSQVLAYFDQPAYFASTLYQCLNGNAHLYCRLKNAQSGNNSFTNTVVEITGNGCLSQVVCALLNAAFFNGPGFPNYNPFPLKVDGVMTTITSYIGGKITDSGDAKTRASNMTRYFNSTVTDGYPCDAIGSVNDVDALVTTS